MIGELRTIEGAVVGLRRGGSVELGDDVQEAADEDLPSLLEYRDVVRVEHRLDPDRLKRSRVDRLLGRDRQFIEHVDVLLEDEVGEGDHISIEARSLDELGRYWIPVPDAALVRIDHESERPQPSGDVEPDRSITDRLRVEIPIIDRVDGEIARRWRLAKLRWRSSR